MSTTTTVNDVVPPHCERCDRALFTTEELNRRIDWAVDLCDHCLDEEERTSCWCTYGWFTGGDPRQFQPDEENRSDEIAAWRAACEAWARGEYVNPAAEEHGPWVQPGTGRVTIGARPSPEAIGHCSAPRVYGMGSLLCDQHKAPLDAWQSWPVKRSERTQPPAPTEAGPCATARDDDWE